MLVADGRIVLLLISDYFYRMPLGSSTDDVYLYRDKIIPVCNCVDYKL